VLWWRGNLIDGLNVQAGVIVLRPDFVAFVPTEQAKNLLGTLAGGLAEAASPFQTVSLDWLRRRPDPLQMIEDLWAERPDSFVESVIEIAGRLGGLVWFPQSTRVARTGMKSTGLIFVKGPTELRGYAPAGAELDRLLEGWQETEPPILGDVIGILVVSLLPLFMAAASFVGHLLSDDIPSWASLIWLGVAGLLYLLVAGKVAWLRLKRKGKPQAGGPNLERTDSK